MNQNWSLKEMYNECKPSNHYHIFIGKELNDWKEKHNIIINELEKRSYHKCKVEINGIIYSLRWCKDGKKSRPKFSLHGGKKELMAISKITGDEVVSEKY